jgi:hypothetical protein
MRHIRAINMRIHYVITDLGSYKLRCPGGLQFNVCEIRLAASRSEKSDTRAHRHDYLVGILSFRNEIR